MNLKMRVKLGIICVLFYLSAFFITPLLYYKASDGNEKYELFEALYMEHLSDSICYNSNTQFQKVELIFKYVSAHCTKPKNDEAPVYSNAYQVHVHRSAYCDQQVLLLSKLLTSIKTGTETIYLFNPDSSISHTILQAYLTKDTLALDPFYHAFWAIDKKNCFSIQSLLADSTNSLCKKPEFSFYRAFIQKGSTITLRRRENLSKRNTIVTRWFLYSNLFTADLLRRIVCSERNKNLFNLNGNRH